MPFPTEAPAPAQPVLQPQYPPAAAEPIPQPQYAPPAQQPAPVQHHTDVLGILSIIAPFIGFSLIGLILGLIGASQAKKHQRSPVLSRIGWIISLIITLLFVIAIFLPLLFASMPRTQKLARDIDRKSDISTNTAKLETYFNDYGSYPSSLALVDNAVLKDSQGTAYIYTPSPAGCTTDCTSFEISATLEAESMPYTRQSLHN
jgi:hypothetical protein